MGEIYLGVIFVLIAMSLIIIASVYLEKRDYLGPNTIFLIFIALAGWTAAYGLSFIYSEFYLRVIWNNIKYIGVVFIPILMLLFSFSFTKKNNISGKTIIKLCIIPIITLILITTNQYHSLIWKDISQIEVGNMVLLDIKYGPWFWVHTLYSYIIIGISIFIILKDYINSPKLFRKQKMIIVLGMLTPCIVNLFSFLIYVDITPIPFTITALIIFFVSLRNNDLDIIPIARNTIFEKLENIVIVLDNYGKILDLNNSAFKIIKKEKLKILGRAFYELSKENKKIFSDIFKASLENEKLILIVENENRCYDVKKTIIYNNDKRRIGELFVLSDITHLETTMNKLEFLSFHDALTGLHNRAYFESRLIEEERKNTLPISVIMGDVNGLKIANDAFGHAEGDILLKEVAQVLSNACSKDAVIARIGGDEFGIILPNCDKEKVKKVISDIDEKFKNTKASKIKISLAIGYTSKESNEQNLSQLLKRADDYMYRKKLLESKSIHNSIITSLQRTLEESSYETREHAQRTKNLAEKLGINLGLPDNQLNDLMLLALLHDIGKIAIPYNILMKPGKLSKDEWEIMKTHCDKGYHIASSSAELHSIAEEILSHHERWDGKGYPQGLKEDGIPLLARIISIVDTYDVLTHDRIYHNAISKESALKEIDKCSGIQFDPDIVKAFIEMLK